MNKNNDVFKTMDLSLAAFLKTIGHQIDRIDVRHQGRKATICFEYTDDLLNDKNKFFNGEAKVDPQSFSNNIRNLKSRINNEFTISE
jgi:hypothetical protein